MQGSGPPTQSRLSATVARRHELSVQQCLRDEALGHCARNCLQSHELQSGLTMPMEGRAGLGLTARKLGGKGARCETSVMWYAKAAGTMQCMKCGRDIPTGAACLSQLPCDLPAGIHRSGYMNFCIHCFEWSSGGPPEPGCTLSREHLQQEKTEDSVSCHYCQETIPLNAEAFAWTFFDWPKSSRSRSDPVARNLHGETRRGSLDWRVAQGQGWVGPPQSRHATPVPDPWPGARTGFPDIGRGSKAV